MDATSGRAGGRAGKRAPQDTAARCCQGSAVLKRNTKTLQCSGRSGSPVMRWDEAVSRLPARAGARGAWGAACEARLKCGSAALEATPCGRKLLHLLPKYKPAGSHSFDPG